MRRTLAAAALVLAGSLAGCGGGARAIDVAAGTATTITPGCTATFTFGFGTATAHPSAACNVPGAYVMLSWHEFALDKNFPENLFDSATGPPWTVNLDTSAPCFYQIDFAAATPHPRHVYAGAQGLNTDNCAAAVTTTTTTATTATTIAVPAVIPTTTSIAPAPATATSVPVARPAPLTPALAVTG